MQTIRSRDKLDVATTLEEKANTLYKAGRLDAAVEALRRSLDTAELAPDVNDHARNP
jgi:hypothetical protein